MDGLVCPDPSLLSDHHRLLGWSLFYDGKVRAAFTFRGKSRGLKTKETIYSILRSKGISLSQGLDIAEVTIQHREN